MSTTTFASDTPIETSVPAAPSQLRLTIDNDGDNILLQANGIPGQQYLLESSDDLASWQQTPIATDNQGAIRFNAEKKDKQFYRVSEAP
jgi:hypothetical protein